METKSRYILIGVFTLAVIAAGFGFVYWLYNTGGLGARAAYKIRFESPVSGLLIGSAVLFNGIRVGEVIDLKLVAENPKQVDATVAVDPATPVHADTRVELDFQGLTGAPVISLVGGSPASPLLEPANGNVPLLVAEPDAGQSMTQSAREVMKRIDGILTENSKPLHDVIANLNTFSEALARNTEHVDGIMAGLERLSGGSGKAKTPIFDLNAPRSFPAFKKAVHGQIMIGEPSSLIALNSDRILIRQTGGESVPLESAQWSDSVPALIQAKVVEGFENAGYLQSVSRRIEGLEPDYQVLLDIRRFEIAEAAVPKAEVEFVAKVVASQGKVIGSKVFHSEATAKAMDAPSAAAALDEAFGKTVIELVTWTSGVIGSAPPPAPPPPPAP